MTRLIAWTRATQILLLSLGLSLGAASASHGEVINVTLLQLNDVYEITPVEGGKSGGLARLATLRQQLLAENPHTFTILAGDALSPSALGTAKIKGERLAGRQMVAVLNAMGLDYATFGNHEFDLTQAEFLHRLGESTFQWISSNVSNAAGQPFAGVPRSRIVTIPTRSGISLRIGLIGLTIGSNPTAYVQYQDPIQAAQEQIALLRGQVDVLVAISHLSLDQDQQLAAAAPDIDLILGGHEHENVQQWRLVNRPQRYERCPSQAVPIFKADANARTVYIHRLRYDTQTRCLVIEARLQPITADIPDHPPTAKVVRQWVELGFQAFRQNGFKPEQVVGFTTEALDGLESSVRTQPTALTRLIAHAMLQEVGDAELAIFNGGSIRIDDRIPPGPITQYDVIRILPFGGKVLAVQLPGTLLQRVLTQGLANRGQGGYLQTANVTQDRAGKWLISGQPLHPQHSYKVAINDFLMSGREQGLDFLNFQAAGVVQLAEKRDIRLVVMQAFQQASPPQP